MKDAFIDYILLYGTLNPQQIELVRASLTERHYSPGQYFLEAGKVSTEIGFIVEGVFRVCYYDKSGSEITKYFLDEQHFIADLNSYNSLMPSTEYVEAIVDAKVAVIRKSDMENLSRTIIGWDGIIGQITAKALSEKVNKISLMLPREAKDRYAFFLDRFPGLANRVPLQYIASYIGITKSSLSRIRRELVGRRESPTSSPPKSRSNKG